MPYLWSDGLYLFVVDEYVFKGINKYKLIEGKSMLHLKIIFRLVNKFVRKLTLLFKKTKPEILVTDAIKRYNKNNHVGIELPDVLYVHPNTVIDLFVTCSSEYFDPVTQRKVLKTGLIGKYLTIDIIANKNCPENKVLTKEEFTKAS